MKFPLVSILIPCFNASKFIKETLNYATNQSYKNIEIIVQDDGSTDNSFEISQIAATKDNRINVYRNVRNVGMCKNWNFLFSKAKGDYILKLDADDIISDDFISKMMEKALNFDAEIVSSAYEILLANGKKISPVIHHQLKEGFVPNLLSTIIFHNPFSLVFTIIKKEFIEKHKIKGNYFMETEVGDAEFLIRSALYGVKLYYLPEKLGYYRIHESNSSHSPLKQTKSFYFDVLPYYHDQLKKEDTFNYIKKLNIDIGLYLRQLLTGSVPFNFKLILQMIRLRIK